MVAPPPPTRSPKGRGKRGENVEPKERALKAKGEKKMRDAMAHKVCGAVREGGKLHISEDPLFPLSYVACFKDNSLFFFFAKGLCNVRATLPRQRDYTNMPHEEDKTHKQTHPICATLKRNVQRQTTNGREKMANKRVSRSTYDDNGNAALALFLFAPNNPTKPTTTSARWGAYPRLKRQQKRRETLRRTAIETQQASVAFPLLAFLSRRESVRWPP